MRGWLLVGSAVFVGACATARVADRGAPEEGTITAKAAADPNCFSSSELGFELDKPKGNEWALATNVKSPDGNPIPVVVAHPESGAQIVVQVSEPVDRPEALAKMLRGRLDEQTPIDLDAPRKLEMDAGVEAYGFDFAVKGEAKGRVAIIGVGDQIVLVVASWPETADASVVKAIDSVVRSVRMPSNAVPTHARPDRL